ncbi:MAG: molybdate ABC transporter substrate-binding protein [Candidatus Hydrogenedentes bacterium]|nr:molybdate ABC transporter substrate-binding protein [Candidatus Hydrogenedentota bacterium]
MNRPLKLIVSTLLLLGGLGALLVVQRPTVNDSGAALMMYCAAGMTKPVEEIVAQYKAEYGVEVQLQFGGSGTLLSNIEVAQQGDLFLAADATYIDIAREKELLDESMEIARLRPVLVVAKGNPHQVKSPQDLLSGALRISLANPDAASVGKVTKDLFTKLGMWEKISAVTTEKGVFKPTVNDIANDVKIGAVDVGLVWDAVAAQYPDLDAVNFPEADAFVQKTTVGILKTAKQPTAVLRFARYLTARDKGLPIFEKHHFPPVDGDAWAVTPEVLYYSGGVNRVAIEKTLKAFQEREGVAITTVYNGCGILVGQIKTGEQPDVYHTCDASFMAGVEERFTKADPISRTAILIAVQKGNPKGIHELADLAKEGLQVGLCNEKESTLGALTVKMLQDLGIHDAVFKNVVVTTPTADLLVSQLTVGKLDAAVIYRANTTYVMDRIDILEIKTPGAMATQTYAVSNQTDYPKLLERLHFAIRSAESQSLFGNAGFEYLPPAGS